MFFYTCINWFGVFQSSFWKTVFFILRFLCQTLWRYLDFYLLTVWQLSWELFVYIFGVVRPFSKVRQHWVWLDIWMGGYFGIELCCWQPNGLFITEMQCEAMKAKTQASRKSFQTILDGICHLYHHLSLKLWIVWQESCSYW